MHIAHELRSYSYYLSHFTISLFSKYSVLYKVDTNSCNRETIPCSILVFTVKCLRSSVWILNFRVQVQVFPVALSVQKSNSYKSEDIRPHPSLFNPGGSEGILLI
jgi:hypothetical protein